MADTPKKSDEPLRAESVGSWGLGFVFCVLGGTALVLQLMRSATDRPLWLDEMLTYYQVSGKTPMDVCDSLRAGVNVLPPLYFLMLSGALQFVPFTPSLARGLSCLFIVGTLPVMWLALRQVAGKWWTLAAVGGVVFSSPLIFFHNAEARPYGLYLFLGALLLLGFVRSAGEEKSSSGTLILLAVTNALLPAAHYFGGIYAASALSVTVAMDVRDKRWRPGLYGAYAIGWAVFAMTVGPIFREQFFEHTSDATTWLPSAAKSLRAWTKQEIMAVLPLTVLAGLLGVLLPRTAAPRTRTKRTQEPENENDRGMRANVRRVRVSCALLAAVWIALPLVFILQAFVTGKNFYFDRYFIVSEIGVMMASALVASAVCHRWFGSNALENATLSGEQRRMAMALIAIMVAALAARFAWGGRFVAWGNDDRLLAALHGQPKIPKTTFSYPLYTIAHFHRRPGEYYVCLTRRPHDERTVARFSAEQQMMAPESLTRLPEFLFIESSDTPQEFEIEAWAKTHRYEIERVGEYSETPGEPKGLYRLRRAPASSI